MKDGVIDPPPLYLGMGIGYRFGLNAQFSPGYIPGIIFRVTKQARQLTWTLQDSQDKQHGEMPIRFLIHDRDSKFTSSFDNVFEWEGIEIILTPYRSPKANAFAERWVRAVREECLDRLLIVSQAHLRRVMQEYVNYYNQARPHQGIEQRCPIPIYSPDKEGAVKRRNVLGGIIYDYHREAA